MKKIYLIFCALLVIASCKKDNGGDPTGNDMLLNQKYFELSNQALLNYQDNATSEASCKGHHNKGYTFINKGSGTAAYIVGGCGTGTVKLVANGTGQGTFLGNFTQTTSFCMDAATGIPTGPITGTLKAANGHELYYTFVSAGVDPSTGYIFQNYVFSGGTGRFEDATGNVTLLYSVNTATAYSYTGKGTIYFGND